MMEQSRYEEVLQRAEKALEEHSKTLTTKDRKKMKKSTFCGPGRSFPVNDCSHAAAAKAFLGRSKFSASTKAKIAACINRKAKALGCGGEKKAKAGWVDDYFPKYIELGAEEKKLYSSDIFAATRDLVEKSLTNPNMELDWTDYQEEIE
jgi:hypothetical protein